MRSVSIEQQNNPMTDSFSRNTRNVIINDKFMSTSHSNAICNLFHSGNEIGWESVIFNLMSNCIECWWSFSMSGNLHEKRWVHQEFSTFKMFHQSKAACSLSNWWRTKQKPPRNDDTLTENRVRIEMQLLHNIKYLLHYYYYHDVVSGFFFCHAFRPSRDAR